jgi:hypothetical protein
MYNLRFKSDVQKSQNSGCHLKIKGARRVILVKLRSEDTQILDKILYIFKKMFYTNILTRLPIFEFF